MMEDRERLLRLAECYLKDTQIKEELIDIVLSFEESEQAGQRLTIEQIRDALVKVSYAILSPEAREVVDKLAPRKNRYDFIFLCVIMQLTGCKERLGEL